MINNMENIINKPEFLFLEDLVKQDTNFLGDKYVKKLNSFYKTFKRFCQKQKFDNFIGKEEIDLSPVEEWWYSYFIKELTHDNSSFSFEALFL